MSALILHDLNILLFYTCIIFYDTGTGRSYSKMSMVSGLKVY